MNLVEACLKELLITQHPEDESLVRRFDSLGQLLEYTDKNLSDDDIASLQFMFHEYLDNSEFPHTDEIETGEFRHDIPLPQIKDLKRPPRMVLLDSKENVSIEAYMDLIEAMYSFEKTYLDQNDLPTSMDDYLIWVSKQHDVFLNPIIAWKASTNYRMVSRSPEYRRIQQTYTTTMMLRVDPIRLRQKRYYKIATLLSRARGVLMQSQINEFDELGSAAIKSFLTKK